MISHFLLERPELAATAAECMSLATSHHAAGDYLAAVLPMARAALTADYAAVVRCSHGEWSVLVEAGAKRKLPTSFLADVLDDDAPGAFGGWQAASLEPKAESGELFVLESASRSPTAATLARLDGVAKTLGLGLKTVRERHQQQWRIVRLETILDVAARWNQHHQVETLLTDMAEAATRLIGADRASIFLWDRPSRTLVARPALGVKEDDELRIP
ncbi:MAG: hypothetical protein ACREHD_16570, partial [Pirellulales bacterium]